MRNGWLQRGALVLAAACAVACVDLDASLEEPGTGGAGGSSGGAGSGGAGGAGGVAIERLCAQAGGGGAGGGGERDGSLELDGQTWVEFETFGETLDPQPFFAEIWLKPRDAGATAPLMGSRRAGEPSGWELWLEAGSPVFRVHLPSTAGGAETKELVGLGELPALRWTHVAVAVKVTPVEVSPGVVEDRLNAFVYVNGVHDTTAVIGGANDLLVGSSQSFWIGGRGCEGGSCFQGLIDEVRVQTGVLNDLGIRRDSLRPLQGGLQSVRALYRFGDRGSFVCDSAEGDRSGQRAVRVGNDGRILRDGQLSIGLWSAPSTVARAPIDAGAACNDGQGFPLPAGLWACLPRIAPFPGQPLDALDPPVCGSSHRICTDADATLRTIGFDVGEQLPGCFVLSATAATCGRCDPATETAAFGMGCASREPTGTGGCLLEGSIGTGVPANGDTIDRCQWRGSYNGAVCCPL